MSQGIRRAFWVVVMALTGMLGETRVLAEPAEIAWESGTFEEALQTAQREKRPLFVFFHTEWCGACHVMWEETFKVESVVQYLNSHVVSYHVDGDRFRDLVEKFHLAGYPTSVVLDEHGEEKGRLLGSADATEFMTTFAEIVDHGQTISELMGQLDADPNSGEIKYAIFKKLNEIGILDQAIVFKNRLEREHPQYYESIKGEILWDLAQSYFLDMKLNDAIQLAEQILVEVPQFPRQQILRFIVNCHEYGGAYQSAFAVLERALGEFSEDLGFYMSYLSLAADTKINLERATDLGEKALEISTPDGMAAYLRYLLAKVYRERGMKDKALGAIDAAIALEPSEEFKKDYQKFRDRLVEQEGFGGFAG